MFVSERKCLDYGHFPHLLGKLYQNMIIKGKGIKDAVNFEINNSMILFNKDYWTETENVYVLRIQVAYEKLFCVVRI